MGGLGGDGEGERAERMIHQEPQAARALNRWPGQLPDAVNVLPSQPQYWRASRVQAREARAQVPLPSPQPSPSQTPEVQSAAVEHFAPSAPGFGLEVGSEVGPEVGRGRGFGFDGREPPPPPLLATQAMIMQRLMMRTARMHASYSNPRSYEITRDRAQPRAGEGEEVRHTALVRRRRLECGRSRSVLSP